MSADDPKSIPAPAQVPTPVLPPFRPAVPLAAASPNSQYEFGQAENLTLKNLGSRMSFVGLFMLGSGLFFFGSVIVRWFHVHDVDVGLLFGALLFVVIGIWTHRAGREFRSVAETEGNDISHLMGALENLLKFYTLLYTLFFIVLVFAIIQLGAHSLYGILPTRFDAQGVQAPAEPG